MTKKILFGVIILIVFVAGFYSGARVGAHEFLLANSQYEASVLAYQLQALRAGNVETIIETKEIELDGKLAQHGRFLEGYFRWLWSSYFPSDTRSIRSAVRYRVDKPFDGPDFTNPDSWNPGIKMDEPFVQETIEGQEMLNHYKEKVINLYKDDGV